MGLFRLLARITIGLLFIGHGTQKLFGWFGGGGLREPTGSSSSWAFDRGAASPARRCGRSRWWTSSTRARQRAA
jgi:uncharacterized membrane protein YphA (DoxX/SURF4 family)